MIGGLAFLSPWMLLALAALPLIWLILRLTPPRPTRLDFPPTRILMGLEEKEQTPARTPWWLTALRLAIAALIILALAQPVWRPDAEIVGSGTGDGPLLIVLDNGWDAAPDFAQRIEAAEMAIGDAGRAGRPVGLIATAERRAESLQPASAEEAARRLAAIEPRPWPADRATAAGRLGAAYQPGSAEVLWIASPLDNGDGEILAATLSRIAGASTLLTSSRGLLALKPPENAVDRMRIPVARLGNRAGATILGFDEEGRRILEGQAAFDGGEETVVEIALPADLRNSVARLAIAEEDSAGAVFLLDGRWRRKTVGLVAGQGETAAQPLLEPLTYVERALAPQADLIRPQAANTAETLRTLIDRRASIIVLTDVGNLPPASAEALVQWLADGGTLVRFASPQLASADIDLLPVRLRQGERALGGSLSWEEPQPIGSFAAGSPFERIDVPQDVRVERQILAEPDSLGDAAVWAELSDGTPLVTARNTGNGRIVLFHVTADPRWSNLPLSGAFVEMLTAIVETAGVVGGETPQARPAERDAAASAPWQPLELLDGYGRLRQPAGEAVLVANIDAARPGPDTPPGTYSRAGATRTLNVMEADTALAPLTPERLSWSGRSLGLEPRAATPIWPWLLAAAAVLAALDALAVLALSGRLVPARARTAAAAIVMAAVALALPATGHAQDEQADMQQALDATLATRLAYVVTGDDLVDETSRAGLDGLSRYLAARTALEPAEPIGVDLTEDELAFFSFLYWPMSAAAEVPAAEVMAKVDAYLSNGGTILFDTRDSGGAFLPGSAGATQETEMLRAILSFVDVPPLEPVPEDHVLTKAFYLLRDFPGRWSESDLWVEALTDAPQDPSRPARGGDGVSPVIITGNDLAGAWATTPEGHYLYPTVPSDPMQRELAYRAGVNIVMYTLTGNYKADQVHVPALLERLGQ
ncbi:MAG TPA: DUF4159 domain-containing protein [Afifellaceae bacterium]|nr:DUF4159 domain-containing protein [Afifellaceae bacterium]